MSDITIKSSGGATKFADGTSVKLTAAAPDGATKLQWILNEAPVSGATSKEHTFTMGVATDGEYRVTAEKDNKAIESDRVTLTRETGDEAASIFHATFAKTAGAVGAVVGVVLLIAVFVFVSPLFGMATWTDLEGRLKVAVALGLPATLVGTALVLAGLWMAVVEWRGRLKSPEKGKGAQEGVTTTGADIPGAIKDIVTTVGNLKGAALAMVVGALLMFGTLWVAQSAASTPGPAPTEAPSAPPAGG